jgi:phosphatidylglycerophosphate synthase
VTTGRLIIAVIFPLLLHNPRLALGAYIAALLSDVLDGALARHTGTVSHTGALLDGWVDKILHINGAWAMALHGLMPGWWMWLWFTREIVQWLMFPVLLHDVRNGRVRTYTTSLAGRITAVLLAAAFILTLLGLPTAALWVSFAVAPAGFLTATGYLKHALDDRKRLR